LLLLLLLLLLTIHRTLSGSCLAGAWLVAAAGGREEAAAEREQGARNLTEEVGRHDAAAVLALTAMWREVRRRLTLCCVFAVRT
jgi:hypothetical protein